MITLIMLACLNVNDMNFCAQPLESRIEVVLPKSSIESMQSTTYRFVKDTKYSTITETIYGSQKSPAKPLPMEMNGCQLTTTKNKTYFYEFPCRELKKEIKSEGCSNE